MTTPEGFSEAVKRAAELFPEVNGEPLIPIGADEFTDRGNVSFGLYLQSFLGYLMKKTEYIMTGTLTRIIWHG